jgi:hypothetical protein
VSSGHYRVVLDGLIDYATAARELTSEFASRDFNASGHHVILQTVSVIPQAKGRLALSVTFTGDARGTLQLIGSPRIDHVRNVVTVPDLAFDLRTNSKLVQSYTWLNSTDLRTELRARSRISILPALTKGRDLLREGLNRKLGDAVTLSGSVDSVTVRGLYVTRDGIVIRAEASGSAGMSVKQK